MKTYEPLHCQCTPFDDTRGIKGGMGCARLHNHYRLTHWTDGITFYELRIKKSLAEEFHTLANGKEIIKFLLFSTNL